MGGGSVTVVYIDLLFLLNLAANYLLLLGAGRLAGAQLHRWRIAAGAALGGGYAAILFLPGWGWLAAWPCRICAGVLMVLAAYGAGGRLGRVCVLFFAVSAAMAGGVLGLQLLGSTSLTLQGGVLYSHTDLRLLLVLFAACYAALCLFFRRLGARGGRELAQVELKLLGRSFTLKTLLDSGHTLTEPATNRPVLVADWRALAPCLPAGLRADDPVSGMALCRAAGVRGQLIPYRAVGVERGLLLALRSDGVRVDGREQGELLVALSPTPVDGGEGIQALLGAWEGRGPARAPGPHRHGRERKA